LTGFYWGVNEELIKAMTDVFIEVDVQSIGQLGHGHLSYSHQFSIDSDVPIPMSGMLQIADHGRVEMERGDLASYSIEHRQQRKMVNQINVLIQGQVNVRGDKK
jgi:hypothetical protein